MASSFREVLFNKTETKYASVLYLRRFTKMKLLIKLSEILHEFVS